MSWLEEIRFDANGLVPVIAQDAMSGEILMLAYANRDAVDRSDRTGRAHYWSRSRAELWAKGDSSGHVQEIVDIRVDCDGDALIYRVRQVGPACHTLRKSCFFRVAAGNELIEDEAAGHVVGRVDQVIADRIENPKPGSYTNYLLEQGVDKILKKVGEESTEVVIAAKNESVDELRGETADLIFHLLVLLRSRNLALDAVWKELDARFGRAPRARTPNGGKPEA
jgi:phosphoribosyl-AMP cyclohydrolase / phosphoribosyl-ATP pyrophosphohydrolase